MDPGLIGEHAADGRSAEDAEPVDPAEHGEGLSPLRGSDRLRDVGMARQRPERGADTRQEPQQHEPRELVAPDETEGAQRDEPGAEDHRRAQPDPPQHRASGNVGQQGADGGGAGGKSDQAVANAKARGIERQDGDQQALGERQEQRRHVDGDEERRAVGGDRAVRHGLSGYRLLAVGCSAAGIGSGHEPMVYSGRAAPAAQFFVSGAS